MKPNGMRGLRHVALFCSDLEACERFYADLLGMSVEWRPDPDNVYLTSGSDNLALHRAPAGMRVQVPQRLDHIGFVLAKPEDVDNWYAYLQPKGVSMVNPPKTHRDGARSFYMKDPDGNVVQMIYHPPISDKRG